MSLSVHFCLRVANMFLKFQISFFLLLSCFLFRPIQEKYTYSTGIKKQLQRNKFPRCLFFLLIFFCSLSSYSLSSQWKLSRSYGDINIYTSANKTRLTVSFKEELSKDFKIQKDMVEKTTEKKRQMLSMMGMENWEISSSNTAIEKDSAKIYLQGSYTDSKNRKVHYIEHHYYTPKGALQMLVSHSDPALLKQDGRETTLKPILKEYGF